MSAASLAELVDVSRQAISLYETGRTSPSPDVLRAIASCLNLPEDFFIMPERRYDRGTVFYRSMSSATKSARTRAEHRFAWLRDIVRYQSEFVELPPPNLPDLGLPSDPLLLSSEEIEDAAEQVRRYWGLRDDPIANVVLLLENQGTVIARDRLGAETLDSLSEFVLDEHRPYIMIGTDKGSAARWRFDAAHELGHLILHRNVPSSVLLKPEQHKKIEKQAHRFASAFLLPLAPFGEDLYGVSLDAFRAIKPRWKTSIAMMIMRARQARLIGEETEKQLWIRYSRRGWRRTEPYDDEMPAEEPRLLRRSFELMLTEGAQTPADVLTRLAIAPSDVEALCGLPRAYLAEFSRVSLREGAGAQVIQLPGRSRTS